MKRGYLALYSFPKTVNMTWKGSEVKNWYDTSRAGNCDLCDSQRYFGLHKDVGVCLSNRRTREAEQFSEITLDPISWQWKTFSPFFLNLRFLHFAQNKEKSLRGHKGNMNFPCQIFIDFRNAKQEKNFPNWNKVRREIIHIHKTMHPDFPTKVRWWSPFFLDSFWPLMAGRKISFEVCFPRNAFVTLQWTGSCF